MSRQAEDAGRDKEIDIGEGAVLRLIERMLPGAGFDLPGTPGRIVNTGRGQRG